MLHHWNFEKREYKKNIFPYIFPTIDRQATVYSVWEKKVQEEKFICKCRNTVRENGLMLSISPFRCSN